MNNAWGTVCDQSWTPEDARVVCRQLGLPAVGKIKFHSSLYDTHFYSAVLLGATGITGGFFGSGVGQIALSNVQCIGTESKLADCPSGVITCSHGRDAGVRCLPQTGNFAYTTS